MQNTGIFKTLSNPTMTRGIGTFKYYAFGSAINEMQYKSDTAGSYRYGFNNKETDLETDLQDYGFRIYNPSIGKFLSVDPLSSKYPFLSCFQFASNNPILYIDIDGLEGGLPIPIPRIFIPRLGPLWMPLPPVPPMLPPLPISISWSEFLNPVLPIPPICPLPPYLFHPKPAIPAPPIPILKAQKYMPGELDDISWEGGYKEPIPGNLRNNKPKDDVPEWVRGYRPRNGEDGKTWAKRLLDEKYGEGGWTKVPKSEFKRIQKWGDGHFKNSKNSSLLLQYQEENQVYNKEYEQYIQKLEKYNKLMNWINENQDTYKKFQEEMNEYKGDLKDYYDNLNENGILMG